MRKFLAMLLAASMLICMVPAFSLVATAEGEEEVQYGLNADYYAIPGIRYDASPYRGVIGTDSGEDERASFDDTQRYDESINQLLSISVVDGTTENVTEFWNNLPNQDGYMIKWTGTITAAASGTYYFAGREIDNGFVAKVEQNGEMKTVYEYWASHHWFDGLDQNAPLYSEVGFTLEAGVATNVELWFLETNGGQILNMWISDTANENAAPLADAVANGDFTFALTATKYASNIAAYDDAQHDIIKQYLTPGVNADNEEQTDSNGCPANMEKNHQYAASLANIKSEMVLIGSTVVANHEFENFDWSFGGQQFGILNDDFLIDYTGYITPTYDGTYEFGTAKVDNCLYVEIEVDGVWVPVYEFWAKNVWNDNSETYYGKTIDLEAGKSYKYHAAFLEINGGQAIETRVKIDDVVNTLAASGLKYTLAPMETAPEVTSQYYITNQNAEWHYMTSGEGNTEAAPENWITDSSVYREWATTTDLTASWQTGDPPTNNKTIWAVTEFTVEDLDAIADWALMAKMNFDDNIQVYVNGTLVYRYADWRDWDETYMFAAKASDVLVEGTNVLSVTLSQGSGGFRMRMIDFYVTKDDTSSFVPSITYISTPDELAAFAATMNAATAVEGQSNITANNVAYLTADIDMTGMDWTPLTRYIGKFYGEGHTISNITAKASTTGNAGLFVNELANGGGNGTIENVIFENCTLTAESDKVAIVAGLVDRGIVRDVTVKNCTVDNTGAEAAGIAGEVCWASDGEDVVVENCAVIGTAITARDNVAGIFCKGYGAKVRLNKVTILDNTLSSGDKQEPIFLSSDGGNIITEVHSNLALDGKPYQFYAQTRVNADDNTLTDYRVICVADLEWLQGVNKADITISFTNGTETKSMTKTPSTVYKEVTAKGEGYTDYYTTSDGAVIFGWVVKGVPAGYNPGVAIETDMVVGSEGELPTQDWEQIPA